MNRRIGYFGGAFFLLSAAFYVRNVALISFMERTWPPFGHPSLLLHTAAIALAGLQWVLCRRGRRSAAQLRAIDLGGLLGGTALYDALTVSEARGFEHAVAVQSAGAEVMLVALISMAFVVTHAIVVPATVRRMFWVSTAAVAMGPVAAYLITVEGVPAEYLAKHPWLPLMEAGYVAMWGIMIVAVSTIAARVIHGLQQRVRDANEIGQYRLEDKIGEGGMGVVYLARHALLRRPTAVKLLASDRAGEQAVRRFEQEVQLTSGLTHPNTIAIYDFGRTPDGIFYYVMEYLDGITLEDLVAQDGAQPAARVVHILKQVCGALVEAHAVGLIHRDIKPSNLMLCVRGRIPDHVKVLDFGLVKEYGGQGVEGLSVANTFVGTPAYLAPEAILTPAHLDPRSDLYAVGAVAYHLLVGEPVFAGKTVFETCAHHLHSEPLPPSRRAAHSIPATLERLVLQCLAKDPAARPRTAADIISALEPLTGIGTWTQDEAARWWRDRAPVVAQSARSQRTAGSSSGPRTVAVDVERRGRRSTG
ncbi:MAG: serine/threonine-protein kinase [Myxococcales bacterium]